jgi:hypothetical protein
VSSPAAHDVLPWVSENKPKIGSTSVSFMEHVYLDLCIAVHVYLNDEFINIPNTAITNEKLWRITKQKPTEILIKRRK